MGSDENEDDIGIENSLTVVECSNCKSYTLLLLEAQWKSLEDCLQSSDKSKSGIHLVNSEQDAVCLWLLSQVCHNQHDLDTKLDESPFTTYPKDEYAKLIYEQGTAVGFYTLKLKGKPYSSSVLETYSMTMVDTMYVRKPWRGKGLGHQLLEDVFSSFPMQSIGFTQPVSRSLLNSLWKLLLQRKDLRDKLWLCAYTGEEGYKENAWFHLRMQHRSDLVQHRESECME